MRLSTIKTNPREYLESWSFKEPNSGCWLWEGFLVGGYGRCTIGKKKAIYAHRLSYETFVAPIPDGLSILHKCDTPACVNPQHLFVGTHTDNMQDAVRKGRHFMQRHPELSSLRGHERRGERSILSKLTDAAVADIQSQKGNTKALCVKYGVHRSTIQRARRGEWDTPLSARRKN